MLTYGPADATTAVVFGHGFTGSQRNPKVVELAQRLAAGGLRVYTADFRGHGESGGLSTLGDLEVTDLATIVAVARDAHERVVSIGASMGGFIALRHAALGGDVDAVIAISSPTGDGTPGLPRARLLRQAARTERGRWLLDRYGTRVGPFTTITVGPPALADISPVPVVIIHGTRDRYVPLSDARAIYERLSEPKRLVVLPGFGHAEAAFTPDFAVLLEQLIADAVRAR